MKSSHFILNYLHTGENPHRHISVQVSLPPLNTIFQGTRFFELMQVLQMSRTVSIEPGITTFCIFLRNSWTYFYMIKDVWFWFFWWTFNIEFKFLVSFYSFSIFIFFLIYVVENSIRHEIAKRFPSRGKINSHNLIQFYFLTRFCSNNITIKTTTKRLS